MALQQVGHHAEARLCYCLTHLWISQNLLLDGRDGVGIIAGRDAPLGSIQVGQHHGQAAWTVRVAVAVRNVPVVCRVPAVVPGLPKQPQRWEEVPAPQARSVGSAVVGATDVAAPAASKAAVFGRNKSTPTGSPSRRDNAGSSGYNSRPRSDKRSSATSCTWKSTSSGAAKTTSTSRKPSSSSTTTKGTASATTTTKSMSPAAKSATATKTAPFDKHLFFAIHT